MLAKAGKIIFVFLILFLLIVFTPRLLLIGKSTPHKVYLAFGFHGNLYHSFRIDTNDEAGFGRDIRVIRHIIQTFDEFNKRGIPAKAVWDIENLFSLQETLPKYAPDIIQNIQRRVKENGDEVILMSYNNGLVSALTKKEFKDAIQRAIRNPQKSGVEDLFEKWSPIVRPQEMMTTPGNFALYKELGINTVSLYYSAIPFDSFRVFVRELSKTEAHNPLLYVNSETKEEIQLIPTYNIGDLVENVSLRNWVKTLHREQLKGNINQDVLLFINFDADDNYWAGLSLPSYLKWLPNTRGIAQLLEEVSDLEYVQFTNLAEYLKSHPPVSKVSFGQDTADGSFDGYNSWAEKSYSHEFWTEVVHDRRTHTLIQKLFDKFLNSPIPEDIQEELNNSYEKRLRLTSTTNFGMATPFLARDRERVVEQIIEEMKSHSQKAWNQSLDLVKKYFSIKQLNQANLSFVESFLLIQEKEGYGNFITLQNLNLNQDNLYLFDKSGNEIKIYNISHEPNTVKLFIPRNQKISDGVYFLYSGKLERNLEPEYSTFANPKQLQNNFITIEFSEQGLVQSVSFSGEQVMLSGSLIPQIQYGEGKFFSPKELKVEVLKDGKKGVAQVQLTGNFSLENEIESGKVNYVFTLIEGVPYLYLDAHFKYPETVRNKIIKPDFPSLTRKIDNNWIETAPSPVKFAGLATKETPFKVIKRNYLGVESSYLIDYFQHSNENLNLDNVNNHITAEYVALAGEKNGIGIAMDTSVLANFAFCPIKIRYDKEKFSASLNPFGTYYGKQYFHPTWGHRQGFESSFLTGQQYWTSASTYNGYEYKFSLMFGFFSGRELPKTLKKDMIGFAHPMQVIQKKQESQKLKLTEAKTPQGFIASYGLHPTQKVFGVYFHWEKTKAKSIKVQIGKQSQKYEVEYKQDGNKTSLFVENFKEGEKFTLGETYYAVVSSISEDGKESEQSEEVSFTPSENSQAKEHLKIGILLQLKILFLSLLAYLF